VVRMSRMIRVPFAGEGSGVDALTWGQVGIWHAILREGGSIAIGGSMPLPATTTVDTIVGLLSYIVGRHESLRTRLQLDEEGNEGQRVWSSGETRLEVVDAVDADPADVAESVRCRYRETPFDSFNEWPARWAVVCRAGVVTHLVVMYNHLALDGHGLEALTRDLTTMDPDSGRATAPVAGITPRAQAELQRTAAHRRQSDTAMTWWANALTTIPAQRFGPARQPEQPRYRELYFNSPATYRAVQLIVARDQFQSSHVLLALYAVALFRTTGRSPSVAQVLVSNRFRPGFGESVSPLTQTGLCVIDVADATFDQVLKSAWRTSIRIGMHSYYDTIRQEEIVAEVNRNRGEVDLSCFFNDRRIQATGETDVVPTLEEVRAAVTETVLRWGDGHDRPNERLYLHVIDTPGTIDLLLVGDTAFVPAGDMETFVWALESMALAAAADPQAPTTATPLGVPDVVAGAGA
jgi:hypothetical protein